MKKRDAYVDVKESGERGYVEEQVQEARDVPNKAENLDHAMSLKQRMILRNRSTATKFGFIERLCISLHS